MPSRSCWRLPPDARGHILRRAEEPSGSGEVEKGVAVASRLDGRRVDPKDLVQRARGTGIEPRVGGQHDEIGTEPLRLAHRHSPLQPRQPGLGRERQDGGPVGAGRCYRQRPGSERGRNQAFEGGAEGGRVDEQDGAHKTVSWKLGA